MIFKRCQISAKIIVETSQKKCPDHRNFFLHDFKRCHHFTNKNSWSFSDLFRVFGAEISKHVQTSSKHDPEFTPNSYRIPSPLRKFTNIHICCGPWILTSSNADWGTICRTIFGYTKPLTNLYGTSWKTNMWAILGGSWNYAFLTLSPQGRGVGLFRESLGKSAKALTDNSLIGKAWNKF